MVYSEWGSAMVSPDEFLLHPAASERSELVRGRIRVMTPASGKHGLVSGNIFGLLRSHVRLHRLGICFADSTGYILPNLPNTVRAPDASFVRTDRLPAGGVSDGFLLLAPDLAIEVLSPSESVMSVSEKLDDYFAAGTRAVWVIDPDARSVTVHELGAAPVATGNDDTLRGGSVLPAFACDVAELFEGLAPPAGEVASDEAVEARRHVDCDARGSS